jgi:hypothetical protein
LSAGAQPRALLFAYVVSAAFEVRGVGLRPYVARSLFHLILFSAYEHFMAKKKKPPYARGRAQCIFCGPHKNMSREHIWADWLRKYIPHNMERHKAVFTHIHPDPAKSTREVRKREGDPHARRLKIACKPCNSVWMGDLQELAKPHLVPMLLGKRVGLYRNGQTAVAAWATMFVMTADFINHDYISISAKERRWFMENQKPPSHWRIWIGKFENRIQAGRWYHTVLTFKDDETEIAPGGSEPIGNTQTSTILLGDHLIIHVMSSRIMRRIIKRWELLNAAAPAMTQIWPISIAGSIGLEGWPSAGQPSKRWPITSSSGVIKSPGKWREKTASDASASIISEVISSPSLVSAVFDIWPPKMTTPRRLEDDIRTT